MANHANFGNIGTSTLAVLGTAVLIVNTQDLNEFQLGVAYTFAASASASGLTCNLTDGIGPTDVTAPNQRYWLPGSTPAATIYYDSVGAAQTMNPVGLSIGTIQTVDTRINVDLTSRSQWLKFTFINKDAINGCNLQFVADAS